MSDESSDSDDLSEGETQEPNFEEALVGLERIVHELEEGQIGLSTALARYEQGVSLLRKCYGLLERAERRIELLTGFDPATGPRTEPFDDEASAELEAKGARRTRRRSPGKPAEQRDDAGGKSSRGTGMRPASGSSEVDDPAGLF